MTQQASRELALPARSTVAGARELAAVRAAEDRGFMRGTALGEQDAFEALYLRYAPTVRGLALRIVAAEELADDITQVVFLDLWRKADRYDPARGPVASWLLTITHHKAVDAVRCEDAHRRRRLPAERMDDVVNVRDDTDAADDTAIVIDALAMLDDRQRETLYFAYFGGLTLREVAVHMAVPEGTAKSRARLALVRLRQLLAEAA